MLRHDVLSQFALLLKLFEVLISATCDRNLSLVHRETELLREGIHDAGARFPEAQI